MIYLYLLAGIIYASLDMRKMLHVYRNVKMTRLEICTGFLIFVIAWPVVIVYKIKGGN